MKRIILIFTSVSVILTTALAILGIHEIHNAQLNEILTIEKIAGSMLYKYPQEEQTFINAMTSDTAENIEYGKNVLSHYGYNSETTLLNKYKIPLNAYLFVLLLIIVAVSGGEYALFSYLSAKRRKQEDIILSILDGICFDNCSSSDIKHRIGELDNSYFADSLEKLAQRIRLKSEYLNSEHDNTKTLVTDISHQLKTPISALKACCSMYLETEDKAEKEEFALRIMDQSNKLESLTAALINISRLENNLIHLTPEKVMLDEILINAVNTIYHKALKKKIDIITSEFENIALTLDKKWTSEAISNIIDNAVKYSPENSSIYISAEKLFSFVRIEIKDNGIGISRNEQNKIFRRFYRGNDPVVKNQDGTGVGLYLSRRILEEEGGTVSVRPNNSRGSIFIIQLPL